MCKSLSHSGGEGKGLVLFNTTSWAGGGPKCLPVLHVAAQGLHTHCDGTNAEVGLDIWVWVSLQGLDNVNDICVTKGRKHMVSFLVGATEQENRGALSG